MSVVFRGAAGSPGSTVVTTSVFTTPGSVVAGDTLLVLMAESITGINWNTSIPAGWSSATAITTTASMQLFWIQLTAAPAATYTFTASVAHVAGGLMLGYGGVAGFNPAIANSGQINTSSVNVAAPSITLTKPGDQLLWMGFANSAAGNNTPPVISVPSSFTQRGTQINTTTSTNANVGITAGDFFVAGTGASGALAGGISPAEINGAVLIGLQPSVPGPPVTAPGMEDSFEPGIAAVGQALATTNLW